MFTNAMTTQAAPAPFPLPIIIGMGFAVAVGIVIVFRRHWRRGADKGKP